MAPEDGATATANAAHPLGATTLLTSSLNAAVPTISFHPMVIHFRMDVIALP
jgi:hypothetical protein